VFVGGEAGVGKTALLRRFTDRTDAVRVSWGACDALATPRPLGPFVDVAQAIGGELGELVERGAMPYRVATALLHELSASAPDVLVLEDAHWADEATLDVLRLLGSRVGDAAALVVVSYRDDELERAHPLRVLIGELGRGESVWRLKLEPLSPQAVATLAGPGIDAEALYWKTGGNPFFVTEALAAGGVEIPPTIRDAVLARCARLSAGARTVLDAVAVIPSSVEPWLLAALVEESGHVDECLAHGMLTGASTGVAFRHEFARLAVEDSIPSSHKAELHRKALAQLARPPNGAPDPARLAHHAAAAGDAEAVLKFAPAAGDLAARHGAHQQAAEQYERALRFGDVLPLERRAELLAELAEERYLTDAEGRALDAGQEALACYRTLGDRTRTARQLIRVSPLLRSARKYEQALDAAFEAVALLEELPAGSDLAAAYANVALSYVQIDAVADTTRWGNKAVELAEPLGDAGTVVRALTSIAECEVATGAGDTGLRRFERALEIALDAGLAANAARAYNFLGSAAVLLRRLDLARRAIEDGLEYTNRHGPERVRRRLLAWNARLALDEGDWDEASARAGSVLVAPGTNWRPRVIALVVLGLVRARHGDPGVTSVLDEAAELVAPSTQLQPRALVAAARAEAACLRGEPDEIEAETRTAFTRAHELGEPWSIGELAVWRRRAGISERPAVGAAQPYALLLSGDSARAGTLWHRLGYPYEAAFAFATAEDDELISRGLAELHRLGARPAAEIAARRLRSRGVRRVPRGPRAATRQNPANLTPRELEVLALLAEGMHNREIAQHIFVSTKTVDRHVSAVLRKLGARTRVEAAAEAVRLGITRQDR
jgi:DNA-binding CsgD family transcriptional regulator/tetratricopeptide (TPR) repeat protein